MSTGFVAPPPPPPPLPPGLMASTVLERAQHSVESRVEPLAPQDCLVCREPITQVSPMQVHPACEIDPQVFAADIIARLRRHIVNQPRSLQTKIGPSELGHSCDRRIGHKIAGTKPINGGGVAWKAFVGTCVHAEMERMMAGEEVARWSPNGQLLRGRVMARWHIEERVEVGEYGDGPVSGSTDLFDAGTGIVWDWKFPSANQVKRNYTVKGPGKQYREQAHHYGQGWINRGFEVTHVGIIMLTRDGEFTDRYVFTEKFDPALAAQSMRRVAGLYSAIQFLGANVAIPSFPTADAYCSHCPYFGIDHSDLTTGCPGDASYEAKTTDPFAGLV